MLKSFRAKECLFFIIAGVAPSGYQKELPHMEQRNIVTQFRNLIRLTAKLAMVEQKWTKTDKPVFVTMKLIVSPPRTMRKEERLDILNRANEKPPNTLHLISRAAWMVLKTLVGIVYEKEKQIVATQMIKEYGEDERIEVFVGTVENMEDAKYDLQKAN